MKSTKIHFEKIFIILFFSLLAISLLNYSCSPQYTPNLVNSPLLSNNGEFEGSASLGGTGGDIQSAYAVSNHFGIMANLNSGISNDHAIIELGTGYYSQFKKAGRYGFYCGGGICEKNNSGFCRFFFQPTIGFVTDELEASFSTRFTYFNLRNPINHFLLYSTKRRFSTYFEPALSMKIPIDKIRIFYQIGIYLPLNDYSIKPYEPESLFKGNSLLNVSVGIQICLGKNLTSKINH